MQPKPGFSLRYSWSEASVPPPYHYEYTIEIRKNAGVIAFYPDYPQHHPPVWKKEFTCRPEDLGAISDLCEEYLDKLPFPKATQNRSIGGAVDHLSFMDGERKLEIPSERSEDENDALQPLISAIRSLVPPSIWDELFDKHAHFIQEGR